MLWIKAISSSEKIRSKLTTTRWKLASLITQIQKGKNWQLWSVCRPRRVCLCQGSSSGKPPNSRTRGAWIKKKKKNESQLWILQACILMFVRSELARTLLTVGPWEWQQGRCICEIFHLYKKEWAISVLSSKKCRATEIIKARKDNYMEWFKLMFCVFGQVLLHVHGDI